MSASGRSRRLAGSRQYRPRVVDSELASRLASAGAVVVEGAKACGKTETARQVATSEVLLDVDASARRAVAVDPDLVLDGPTPRLLDEWQVEPDLWNHIRRAVDERGAPGQFVLTGSATPAEDVRRHTGAGRFSILRMRPMTLFETGRSTGAVSLAATLRGEPQRCPAPGLSVRDIAGAIAVGGWPAHLWRSDDEAQRANIDYLEQIRHVDIGRVGGTRRDPARVGRLLASLARNTATEVSISVLANDAGGHEGPLARNTVSDYLDALARLMVIEAQPAWSPHLRSRAVLRSTPKRHFVDPSLAVAALRAGPARLLSDLPFLGCCFESLVVRDLRVLAQSLDGEVSHYRDSSGLEVDAIVQLADGRWAAFEIKLGAGKIDEGVATLSRFRRVIDNTATGHPAALAVIVGTGPGYQRPDGIGVVPVGALGP